MRPSRSVPSLPLSLTNALLLSCAPLEDGENRGFLAILTFLPHDPFVVVDGGHTRCLLCKTNLSDPRQLDEEQTQKEEEEEGGTRRLAEEVTREVTPEVTREVTPEVLPSALLLGKEMVRRVSLLVFRHVQQLLFNAHTINIIID